MEGVTADGVIWTDFVTDPKVVETIAQPVMLRDKVNGKVVYREPAGIVTEVGTEKPALVDFKVATPALAAGVVKMMVHVPLWPGAGVRGEQTRRASEDGERERTIGKETTACPAWARTVAVNPAVMVPARIGNSTEREPAGTVTEAGTARTVGELVVIATGVPPTGAALLSWKEQIALVFGVRVEAEHVSELVPGVVPNIEIITAWLLLPAEAVTVATWFEIIMPAVKAKLVVAAPAGTTADAGKVNRPAGLAVIRRVTPPAGANFEMVAVQVVESDESREVPVQAKEVSVTGAITVRVMG